MKVYTSEQMREHERLAVEQGTSYRQLMENAGSAAAKDILSRYPQSGRALILCGKGNNAGDGLVIARLLQAEGWQIDIIFLLGNRLSELAELNYQLLQGLPAIRFCGAPCLSENIYDIIIDGIFGTGFAGRIPAEIAATCRLANRAAGVKIALDIPSGLNGDTAQADEDTFLADITYTFAAYKPAHLDPKGAGYCGEIVCLDIGID